MVRAIAYEVEDRRFEVVKIEMDKLKIDVVEWTCGWWVRKRGAKAEEVGDL